MSVTNFADEREKRSPHATGPAHCMHCHHEWQFVVPMPVLHTLDCPSCGHEAGRMLGLFECPRPAWECSCGNGRFMVMEGGRMWCEVCGTEHDVE